MPGLQSLQMEQERQPTSSSTTHNPLRAEGFKPPPTSSHPEHYDLWIPSSLSPCVRTSICSPRLITIEERLRTMQCSEALENLRHVLRIKSWMILFKNKNVRGQREGTRSQSIINRVHSHAQASASEYRLARAAKVALSGPGAWESTLCVLLDSDIRAYSDPDKLQPSMGWRRTVEDEFRGLEVLGTAIPEIDLRPEVRGRHDGMGDTHHTLSWIW